MDLVKEQNEHYQQLASYKLDVLPVYVQLKDIDWTLIETLYKVSRQREWISARYSNWQHSRGHYPGKLIYRYSTIYGYAQKIALPISVPAEMDEHHYQEAYNHIKSYFSKQAEEINEAPNKREFVAKQLRNISRIIGKYETQYYGSTSGITSVTTWKPHGAVGQALSVTKRSSSGLNSGDFGRAKAYVEEFWRCWEAFHSYEQIIASINTNIGGGKLAKLSPLIKKEDVREILSDAGLGSLYIKPGEWAAAFRALFIEKALDGVAPQIYKWAKIEGYNIGGLSSMKTPWNQDWTEAGQFKNDAEKTVFRSVQKAVKAKLYQQGER